MTQPRCDLSDLIHEHCVHCITGARNLGPELGDLFDDEEMDQA